MRWTQFFIPTTKETPKDATAASHKLMVRASLIRQLSAGIYSYLPLGYRVLRKVEAIVREEMNRAGGIELHLPVLHPVELWQQTGHKDSIHIQDWPTWDPEIAASQVIQLPIQVNGKKRALIEVDSSASKSEIETIAFESQEVQQHISGQKVLDVIYVPGKILNILTNQSS